MVFYRYGWDCIRVEDLEMANASGHWQGPDFLPTINGWEHSHLGMLPVLYYRKNGVSGDLSDPVGSSSEEDGEEDCGKPTELDS
jgi:hypothetical protein